MSQLTSYSLLGSRSPNSAKMPLYEATLAACRITYKWNTCLSDIYTLKLEGLPACATANYSIAAVQTGGLWEGQELPSVTRSKIEMSGKINSKSIKIKSTQPDTPSGRHRPATLQMHCKPTSLRQGGSNRHWTHVANVHSSSWQGKSDCYLWLFVSSKHSAIFDCIWNSARFTKNNNARQTSVS